MNVSQKLKKYTSDLNGFLERCEKNYALLSFWLTHKVSRFSNKPDSNTSCVVHQLDSGPYTTTWLLTVDIESDAWIDPVALKVRLYHDAQVAEVLETNRNHAPIPNADYPNKRMVYLDDKWQRNRLLTECLNFMMSHKIIGYLDSEIKEHGA